MRSVTKRAFYEIGALSEISWKEPRGEHGRIFKIERSSMARWVTSGLHSGCTLPSARVPTKRHCLRRARLDLRCRGLLLRSGGSGGDGPGPT